MKHTRNLLAAIGARSPVHAAGEPGRGTAAARGRSQATPEPPLQIAAPFPGETAFEMVGRIDHQESAITAYGYLARVVGVTVSVASSAPESPSAATARFTYFTQLVPLVEPAPGDVQVLAAEGTLTVYFSANGGSDLAIADSFFQGTPIATAQVQFQEVLPFSGPDGSVTVAEGTLTQLVATPFAFAGVKYRFGHVGLQERFLLTGTTMSGEPSSRVFMASVAGRATVTSPQTTGDSGEAVTGRADVETSSEPAGSARGREEPLIVDSACEGAEAWLTQAIANAERADAIVAGIPASPSVQSLDPVEVNNTAAVLADLVETQRAAAVPELGLAANRLLVTALSTYSRGATLIERAVADGNEATLAQALAMLQDGNELTARALDQLAAIAESCGIQT